MSLTDEELDRCIKAPEGYCSVGDIMRLVAEVRSLRTALSLAKSEAEAARAQLAEVTAQRDEARAEVARLRATPPGWAEKIAASMLEAEERENLDAPAEVERLRADRGEGRVVTREQVEQAAAIMHDIIYRRIGMEWANPGDTDASERQTWRDAIAAGGRVLGIKVEGDDA